MRGESYNHAIAAEKMSEEKRTAMIETLAPSGSVDEKFDLLKRFFNDETQKAKRKKDMGRIIELNPFRKRGSVLERASRGFALGSLGNLIERAEAAASQEVRQKLIASAMIEAMRLGYAHAQKDEKGTVSVVFEKQKVNGKKGKSEKKKKDTASSQSAEEPKEPADPPTGPENETEQQKYEAFMATADDEIRKRLYEEKMLDEYIINDPAARPQGIGGGHDTEAIVTSVAPLPVAGLACGCIVQ